LLLRLLYDTFNKWLYLAYQNVNRIGSDTEIYLFAWLSMLHLYVQ